MSLAEVLVFRCALLKAILKMCSYANGSLMTELFAHEGDKKVASVLATQLCEVISLVMLNDVRTIDYVNDFVCDYVVQDTVSTHLIVLQIMEQLLNKAGDIFVNQFMRLGTSAKLLEIAGPVDKTSDSVADGAKDPTQDEPDSGATKEAGLSDQPETGKEPDSRFVTKEPESELESGLKEPDSESYSVEPHLESSSKPPDSESKPKEQEPESRSKELELESESKEPDLGSSEQPDSAASEGGPNLASTEELDSESSQKAELVASSEQDFGSNKEPDLEPSQQPDLTSSKEQNAESTMELEPELEVSQSSKKPDKEASSSEEPVSNLFLTLTH